MNYFALSEYHQSGPIPARQATVGVVSGTADFHESAASGISIFTART